MGYAGMELARTIVKAVPKEDLLILDLNGLVPKGQRLLGLLRHCR